LVLSFIDCPRWPGEAADGAAVELDHLSEDAVKRQWCRRRLAAQFRVRPVQAGGEGFALVELGELAQVCFLAASMGRDAGGVAVLGHVPDEPQADDPSVISFPAHRIRSTAVLGGLINEYEAAP
jgi:hypothetical protein